jgi:hypothetical protein
MVVLLHKHFSSWLSTFCNSISIITNCMYATVSESNFLACQQFIHHSQVDLLHLFLLSTCCLSPIFHLHYTRWCRSCFWRIFIPKANTDEGGMTWAVWLFEQRNQSVYLTDGVTVTSFPASLHHRTHMWQHFICRVNWKLLCIFYARSHQSEIVGKEIS